MKAVYAGSFDPFTNGHLHVLWEASHIFEKVYVMMAINPDKKRRTGLFGVKEGIIKTCHAYALDNVEVMQNSGLVADFALEHDAQYLVRGIRNGMDYEYEENMAKVNEKLGLKTIYIRAGELSYISSSMVMELHKHGKDVSMYVPGPVIRHWEEGYI